MERRNGFLIVDDYKKLPDDECVKRGRHVECWLENKEVYLFKSYPDVLSCYKEVVFSRFATKIGIPNVGYDLASRYGKLGVITKKCTEEVPTSIKKLILEYIKIHNLDIRKNYPKLLNITSIEKILKEKYKEKKNFSIQDNHKDLIIKYISQFLLANGDITDKNLDFEEKKGKFIQLYDFGSCGTIQMEQGKGRENFFSLKRFYTENKEENPKIALQTFLNNADRSEVYLFKMYLENACTVSLNDFFAELNSEISAFFPIETEILQRRIELHLNDLQKQCKK